MTKFNLLLALCFIATSGISNAQILIDKRNSSPKAIRSQEVPQLPVAYYETTTSPVRETVLGVEEIGIATDLQNIQIISTGTYGPAARSGRTEEFGENLIYTSGPFINELPDLSIVEVDAEGMDSFGFGAQKASNYSLAEEFVLPMNFDISSIDVYAYQTGTQPPSITAVYIQEWDGDPSRGNASVVRGNLSSNVFDGVEDAGVYRVADYEQNNTERKMQKVTANTNGLSLTTGTYWIEYTLEGSGSSGPWTPPVVVMGETMTGNALQNVDGSWEAVVDYGTFDPQGLPIQIFGVANNGSNSCTELNPPYDWLFEIGLTVTSSSSYSSANDLTLDAGESFTLKNITAYLMSEWPVTNVDVTYYEDYNGLPGSIMGSEDSVTIDGSNAIGTAHTSIHNIYEVNMTVDPFEFTGQESSATSYWIALSATSAQDSDVYWTATYGNMFGNPMARTDGNGWDEYEPNLDGLYIWSGDCSPVLGVEEYELAEFRVHPNPTHDIVYLESSRNIESISLFNILGQEVLARGIDKSTTEISIVGLPIGTYILKTTVEGQVETRKIIKK